MGNEHWIHLMMYMAFSEYDRENHNPNHLKKILEMYILEQSYKLTERCKSHKYK